MLNILLLLLLPTSTFSALVLNNVLLGTAGRPGYWKSTPRKECEHKYPGMEISAVSTVSTSINNLATWSSRGMFYCVSGPWTFLIPLTNIFLFPPSLSFLLSLFSLLLVFLCLLSFQTRTLPRTSITARTCRRNL